MLAGIAPTYEASIREFDAVMQRIPGWSRLQDRQAQMDSQSTNSDENGFLIRITPKVPHGG